MKKLVGDFKKLFVDISHQDWQFKLVCAYLVLSYLRPQAIYPMLNFLPWTQIVILMGLVLCIFSRSLRVDSVLALLFVYMIWILISANHSQYPLISSSKLDVSYIWLLEYAFFVWCIKNLKQLQLVLVVFFLIMFKMSFFGARTWIERGFGFRSWGIAGPDGFFANSGEFSLLMAMVAVLSIAFLVAFDKQKSIYLILPITATMTVLAASSRGGQLALIVGFLYLIIAYRKFKIKNLILIALSSFLIYMVIPDEQKERLSAMGEDDTSQSRLNYWSAGWDMMKEYPVFGVGHYGFAEYYQDNYKAELSSEFLMNRREVAHNSYIEVGSSLGFTGLFLYLLLHLSVYINCKKAESFSTARHDAVIIKNLSTGIIGALVCYVVGSTFMSVEFYPYIYLLLMFSTSLLFVSKKLSNGIKSRSMQRSVV